MEKMNQVSVSEFFAKSKEEMYDDAVAMVEKYNRLVDICNDSSERIAELMAKDDINEFKKELQSREPGELKIQKLADIVVWADGIIRAAGYNEEKYKSDAATAYCHVKAYELWRIRDVALESMERRTVYSNALNKDIADKAAKIELLEKEIEGRKEGYWALKEKMDTKYISIDEHNMINKSLDEKVEIYEKEIERLNRYSKNLETANHNLVTRVTLLEPEIENLKKELEEITKSRDTWFKTAGTHSATIRRDSEEINKLKEENAELRVKVIHQKENLDGINKTLEIRTKENESLIKVRNHKEKEIEAHEEENKKLEKALEKNNEELREMAAKSDHWKDMYYKTLVGRSKEVTKLKTELEDVKDELDNAKKKLDEVIGERDRYIDLVNGLTRDLDYNRKENEELKTDLGEMTATRIKQFFESIEEDDHGKSGFKRYIEHLIEEEERAVPERFKERLNKEITAIFTKEEETEVDDIPCGEDAIE